MKVKPTRKQRWCPVCYGSGVVAVPEGPYRICHFCAGQKVVDRVKPTVAYPMLYKTTVEVMRDRDRERMSNIAKEDEVFKQKEIQYRKSDARRRGLSFDEFLRMKNS